MKAQNLKFPDEQFAVFNLHVNNAGKRAMEVIRHLFLEDNPKLIELEHMYKEGVMEIFKFSPNPVTARFAFACFIFANGLDK